MKFRDKLDRLQLVRSAPAPVPVESVVSYEPDEPAQERAVQAAREVVDMLRTRAVDLPGTPEPRSDKLQKLGGLREQLAGLQARSLHREPRVREEHTPRASRSFVDALLDDQERVSARVPAAERRMPGVREETALGPLYKTVVLHEADHRHGRAEVARATCVQPSEVALIALDASLAELDFSRALYIDTETTGLSGGSGTLPFLIGMAWFEGEQLNVEQLLLPRPGHEAPMLARLAERLELASAVVSYNGKSFDWPLLRTRFVLNRIPTPALPGHLDLLHCARRIYKERLGSVRLVHLEQEILGYERIDDLPGELIPQRYFSFLRGDVDGSALTPILDHNRSDLVALPALLGELVHRFTLASNARQHARDQLGFARVAVRAADPDRALALAHAALESDLRGELSAHALFLVGELQLHKGALEAAVEAFERAVELGNCDYDRARAHLALAKLHEHKTKQCERALAHAERTAAFEGDEACARRTARLTQRIERRAQRASRTRA